MRSIDRLENDIHHDRFDEDTWRAWQDRIPKLPDVKETED